MLAPVDMLHGAASAKAADHIIIIIMYQATVLCRSLVKVLSYWYMQVMQILAAALLSSLLSWCLRFTSSCLDCGAVPVVHSLHEAARSWHAHLMEPHEPDQTPARLRMTMVQQARHVSHK